MQEAGACRLTSSRRRLDRPEVPRRMVEPARVWGMRVTENGEGSELSGFAILRGDFAAEYQPDVECPEVRPGVDEVLWWLLQRPLLRHLFSALSQKLLQGIRLDPNRVGDAYVGKCAPFTQPVHGGPAHPQSLRDLLNGQQSPRAVEHWRHWRGAQQQTSSRNLGVLAYRMGRLDDPGRRKTSVYDGLWTAANGWTAPVVPWGASGRRFKSCRPDHRRPWSFRSNPVTPGPSSFRALVSRACQVRYSGCGHPGRPERLLVLLRRHPR